MVTLGSVVGTLHEVVDDAGRRALVGVLALRSFRPSRPRRSRGAGRADRVIVLERAFALGAGGSSAPTCEPPSAPTGATPVIAGLGGRPSRGARCARCSTAHWRGAGRALPRPERGRRGARAPRSRGGGGLARMWRTSCASWESSRLGRYERDELLPDGHLRGWQPAARRAAHRCSRTLSGPTP